jgi:hypothetical protein
MSLDHPSSYQIEGREGQPEESTSDQVYRLHVEHFEGPLDIEVEVRLSILPQTLTG